MMNWGGYGGGYGGASPYQTSAFGQIGEALGGIGNAAQTWMPAIMQALQMREQSARQNLQMLLGMPGLSEEQKRNAITQYEQSQSHAPSWMRLQWPQQQVPVPGTGQAATPPSFPQGTPETARQVAGPSVPGTPAVPPQMQSQYVVPQQPLGDRLFKDVVSQDVYQQVVGKYPQAANATYAEVSQLPGVDQLLGRQLAPQVDVGTFVAGAYVDPNNKPTADALVVRVNAAVGRGEISAEQGIGVLQNSGLFQNPAQHRTDYQNSLRGKVLAWARDPQGSRINMSVLSQQMSALGMNPNVEIANAKVQARQEQLGLAKTESEVTKNIAEAQHYVTLSKTELGRLANEITRTGIEAARVNNEIRNVSSEIQARTNKKPTLSEVQGAIATRYIHQYGPDVTKWPQEAQAIVRAAPVSNTPEAIRAKALELAQKDPNWFSAKTPKARSDLLNEYVGILSGTPPKNDPLNLR